MTSPQDEREELEAWIALAQQQKRSPREITNAIFAAGYTKQHAAVDTALFRADDAACILYPSSDQSALREAFREGAEHAVGQHAALLAQAREALERIKGGCFPGASNYVLSGNWQGAFNKLQDIAEDTLTALTAATGGGK